MSSGYDGRVAVTIAVSLKVNDGVVLAADSASTLAGTDDQGNVSVMNVYDNANKIVNLVKGTPLGVMAWGAGAIGPSSVSTLFKDLRSMFTGSMPGPGGEDWKVNPEALDVGDVAEKVKRYIFDDLYTQRIGAGPGSPEMGMIVVGYSSGSEHAEEHQVIVKPGGVCDGVERVRPGAESGFSVGGQPEAIARLFMGVDSRMPQVLEEALGVPSDQSAAVTQVLQQHLQAPVLHEAMPFKDALDLAHFMVETTIKMTRFMPGAATVGGPIEVAGITKHEGFKWVQRKHYFHTDLNPKE
ncbi:hypothetical protein [Janibacter melonis]|uniref:hypothetical protein n=1 Tax=Janibacter melonis TaxID=262209 RepID=UPI00174C8973|nr:hypothetical protein [Janibacter melonis]